MSDQKSTTRRIGTAVAGVFLAGTVLAGSLIGQSTTANSLQPQAVAALQQAGISGVDVIFRGREAYLSGQGKTDAELQQAKAVVEAIYGVRWATITGDNSANPSPETTTPPVTPSPTVAVVEPSVNIGTGASGTLLTGTVATQAEADALATQVQRVFGSPVANQMTIVPNCQPEAWVGNLVTALQGSPAVTGGSLLVNNAGVTIGGTVPSAADLATLQQAMAGLQLPVTNSVTVVPPTLTAAEIAQINNTVVNFGAGVYSLDDTARQKLDAIIPLLAKSTVTVTIEGYVSTPPVDGQEVPQSQVRAQVVADYLVANGIEASRLVVVGRGVDNPVASNDTSDGQAANRRATLTVS